MTNQTIPTARPRHGQPGTVTLRATSTFEANGVTVEPGLVFQASAFEALRLWHARLARPVSLGWRAPSIR